MGFISIPCPVFCHMFSFSLEIIGRQHAPTMTILFLIGGPNSVFRPLHRAPGAQPSPHIPLTFPAFAPKGQNICKNDQSHACFKSLMHDDPRQENT